MADPEHLKLLQRDIKPWNMWRVEKPSLRPDLREAHLRGATLFGADLRKANVYGANLAGANLRGAILSGVDLSNVLFNMADLSRVNLAAG